MAASAPPVPVFLFPAICPSINAVFPTWLFSHPLYTRRPRMLKRNPVPDPGFTSPYIMLTYNHYCNGTRALRMADRLRLVFFGQNNRYSFQALKRIGKRHEVKAVVLSMSDRVREGYALAPARLIRRVRRLCGGADLELYAKARGIPFTVMSRHDKEGLISFLKGFPFDIGVVVSMAGLLPQEVLELPAHGFINLHASLLPKYRGPDPWFWHYYYMEKTGGLTVHFLDGETDTGDIVKQASFPISPGLSPGRMYRQACGLGAELLSESLDGLAAGTAVRVPQRELSCRRYARKVKEGEPLVR